MLRLPYIPMHTLTMLNLTIAVMPYVASETDKRGWLLLTSYLESHYVRMG